MCKTGMSVIWATKNSFVPSLFFLSFRHMSIFFLFPCILFHWLWWLCRMSSSLWSYGKKVRFFQEKIKERHDARKHRNFVGFSLRNVRLSTVFINRMILPRLTWPSSSRWSLYWVEHPQCRITWCHTTSENQDGQNDTGYCYWWVRRSLFPWRR